MVWGPVAAGRQVVKAEAARTLDRRPRLSREGLL